VRGRRSPSLPATLVPRYGQTERLRLRPNARHIGGAFTNAQRSRKTLRLILMRALLRKP